MPKCYLEWAVTEQRPLSAEALSDACIEAELLLCEKRWYHEVISRPFTRTGFFYFIRNILSFIARYL